MLILRERLKELALMLERYLADAELLRDGNAVITTRLIALSVVVVRDGAVLLV